MTRLLCTGDRQIGSGGSFDRQPGDRLAEQEQNGHRIVDLAIEHGVDLILDGGDVFEGPTITPAQLDAYILPLERLEGLIPIIVTPGNGRHDLAMRSVNALAPLRHVPGLTVASAPKVIAVAGVAVACLPWVHPGRLIAQQNGGDRDDIHVLASELLLEIARGLLTVIRAEHPGLPAVLLAHWAISGASYPNGLPVEGAREPILPAAELEVIGFDVVVAAHIHKPQMVWPSGFYVGSPMAHNFGEPGEHGVWIVDLDEHGELCAPPLFLLIASRRFITAECDFTFEAVADGTTFEDELHGAAHLAAFKADTGLEGSFLKVRYTATAAQARRIDTGALRQALLDAGAYNVWVEPLIERDVRARVEGLDETVSDTDALSLWLDAQEVPAARHEALRELHGSYLADGCLAEVAA